MSKECCREAPKLIFACSGAADVGAIADQAARRMAKDNVGKMFCLAGVGGRVEPIMDKTRASDRILAIDGCDLDCARKCLELAGIDLKQAGIGARTGAIVLGQWVGGKLHLAASADMVIQPRGILVVAGSHSSINQLSRLAEVSPAVERLSPPRSHHPQPSGPDLRSGSPREAATRHRRPADTVPRPHPPPGRRATSSHTPGRRSR